MVLVIFEIYAFSQLLKLIFYQSTYVATISVKSVHGLSLGLVGGDIFPHFQPNGYNSFKGAKNFNTNNMQT